MKVNRSQLMLRSAPTPPVKKMNRHTQRMNNSEHYHGVVVTTTGWRSVEYSIWS